MKRFYYQQMAEITEMIGWNLFIFEPFGTYHGKWFKRSDSFKRKLSMLEHPSNA